MGRAGSGSSSHGGGSSSHRSSSHGSSSHRMSSSRAGSSRSYSSGSSHNYGGHSYGGYHSYGYSGRSFGSFPIMRTAGLWTTITTIIMILTVLIGFAQTTGIFNKASIPKSTIVREKLTNVPPYNSDCIVDELNWFDSKSSTGRSLKGFYDKTGIQPYVYLLDYDSTLTSDSAKEAWADKHFDSEIAQDNAMVFYYFAERDTDNDVGLMYCCYGNRAGTILDSEAMDIFWALVDGNWYSDMSTDDLFKKIFLSTGDKIMTVSKTGNDVKFMFGAVVFVLIIVVGAIVIITKVVKAKHQKAIDDAKILNSNINDLAEDSNPYGTDDYYK